MVINSCVEVEPVIVTLNTENLESLTLKIVFQENNEHANTLFDQLSQGAVKSDVLGATVTDSPVFRLFHILLKRTEVTINCTRTETSQCQLNLKLPRRKFDYVRELIRSERSNLALSGKVLHVHGAVSNASYIQCLEDLYPKLTFVYAGTTELGLKLAVEHKPNLVLLDQSLFEVYGEQILNESLIQPLLEIGVSSVVLSRSTGSDDINMWLSAGVEDYLLIPFEVEQFERCVSQLLPHDETLTMDS